jgi:hypothetical protein
MSLSTDSAGNFFFSNLTVVERTIFRTERNSYLQNGYSAFESEQAAYQKIQSVRKFKKRNTNLRIL